MTAAALAHVGERFSRFPPVRDTPARAVGAHSAAPVAARGAPTPLDGVGSRPKP